MAQFHTLFTRLSIFTLILGIGASCSVAKRAQIQLRKAEKHIKRAEMLGAKWSTDTIFTERVIHVPGPSTEIQVPVTVLKDTTIVKEKITTVIRWLKGKDGKTDTLTIFTKCPDQVVKDSVATAINKSVVAPPCDGVAKWWRTGFLICFGLIVLVILLRVFKGVVF